MSRERSRVVVATWMIRYPLGGNLSWVLGYVLGFHLLGHEVWLLERAEGPEDCFDPVRGVMTDDPSAGIATVRPLLDRFGLGDRWCFVDWRDEAWGMTYSDAAEIARSADVFIDVGAHGSWAEESSGAQVRVLIDGEPGFTQLRLDAGTHPAGAHDYDAWVTVGANIGTDAADVPSGGKDWIHMFHPVVVDLFDPVAPAPPGASFTTVMNWRSYPPLVVGGRELGQKDRQFVEFTTLPLLVPVGCEAAIAGPAPRGELVASGWHIQSGHQTTVTFEAFRDYLRSSLGEFAVAKHGFVVTRSGWFSDRSAAYLASGRPVVMQDTGFGAALPTGEGLFAVADVHDAAAAITEVVADPDRHARRAREIAADLLDARVLLSRLLDEVSR